MASNVNRSRSLHSSDEDLIKVHSGQAAQTALDRQATLDQRHTPIGEPSPVKTCLTLADLQPGECADILQICGGIKGRLRLLEMGLTPGIHVKVLRAAAFGGPLDVLVRGYQLSLRREEAAAIWIGREKA